MMDRSYASIIGTGLISPAGLGKSPLLRAVWEQKPLSQDGLARISSEDTKSLKDMFPGEKGLALLMSLYSISEALKEAQWNNLDSVDAIILGTTTGQIGLWEDQFSKYSAGTGLESLSEESLSQQPLSTLSDAIKKFFNFKGKVIILSSACSASTQAMISAWELLNSGRASRVIAGGVEEIGKLTVTGFSSLKLLSNEPCTPFDEKRQGINLSEGAAFYALEAGKSASALAYLIGGSTHLDSYHMTSPNPDGMGLIKAINETLELAKLDSKEISFVHAHGTGSTHNDLAEAAAIKTLFPHRPSVSSTKGIHGHALGSSGAIELAICLEALASQKIPGTAGLKILDPKVEIDIPLCPTSKKIKYVLKTTLGFGGINSALVLEARDA